MPSPGISAPGVDVDCTPTPERPTPVVLLHGTRFDKTLNWQYLGPELVALGFCVYSVDLPDRAEGPIRESAKFLAARVDEVLKETGAKRVSIVGHSQGGLVARDFIKREGGLKLVEDYISLGAPQFGYYTEPPGHLVDAVFNLWCASCNEQMQGSDYLKGLNKGDLTPGRVSWTMIITVHDGVAVPVENQYLPEDSALVANITLQDSCPDHYIEHVTLAYDPLVRDWIVDALNRNGPADPKRTVECLPAP